VVYRIEPSGGGFVTGWEYRGVGTATDEEASGSREVSLASHADAPRFLKEEFDAPPESR